MNEELTPEQIEGLRIARDLIEHGVPVFAAAPCPEGCKTPGHQKTEFHLPKAWQKITPSVKQLERWRPGWGLAAVGGHAADFLDADPRSGGDRSETDLREAGYWPRTFGLAETKSGGRHYVISPLRERETNGFMPGLDYQGGDAEGEGRAFVWIAPTVGRSKDPETLGELRPYRWADPPDMEMLEEFAGSDDSGEVVRDRIVSRQHALGSRKETPSPETPPMQPVGDDPFIRTSQLGQTAASGYAGGSREFTQSAAESFVLPSLMALREAKIGEIEEHANRAAVQLSHFVPAFWTPDQAYAILVDNLSHTAYDPTHPAASWTAEKFRPVLDGSRPVRDPWKATKLPDVPEGLTASREAPADDAVEALISEMLSPGDMSEKEPPEQLIDTLLTLDSESWVIGAPGSKKSFVALHMAGCVATGRQFLGLDVQQGRVLMIVAEGSGGTSTRVKAWLKTYGDMGDVKMLPRPIQVTDARAWDVLVEACRRLKPSMVVLDTQARVTVGLDENAARDMGIYVNAVGRIREATGACVLTIHHTGRDGKDARGSSAIDGAQSTELKIEAQDKMTGVLKVEKQKDLEMRDAMPLKFRQIDLGLDKRGKAITSLVLVEDAFENASETEKPQVRDQSVRDAVSEPLTWVVELAGGSLERQRLLQVVHDIGQEDGLTRAEALNAVAARWYAGKIAKTSKEPGVSREVVRKAWSFYLSDRSGPGGEPVLVRERGEKARVNPFIVPDEMS